MQLGWYLVLLGRRRYTRFEEEIGLTLVSTLAFGYNTACSFLGDPILQGAAPSGYPCLLLPLMQMPPSPTFGLTSLCTSNRATLLRCHVFQAPKRDIWSDKGLF